MRKRLLLAALVLAGTAPALGQETLTVGVAVPLTGPLAVLGEEIEQGVRAAAQRINEAGGVDGMTIEVEALDDGCSADEAETVAAQFVAEGVALVVGHLCSAAAIAAAPVYAAAGIVQIAPGAPDPRFAESRAGDGAFRLYGASAAQGIVAAEFLAEQFPGATIAIVDDRTSYGRRLATGVREALGEHGVTAIVSQSYFATELDVATLLRQFQAADVGVVFAAGDTSEMGHLRAGLVAAGFDAPFMTGDVAADPAFRLAAGNASAGTIFTFPPDLAARPEATDAIAAIAAGDGQPSNAVLIGYAAVEIWAAAAEAAGGLGYPELAAAIAAGTFETAVGPVRFNARGEADIAGWAVWRWDEDGYRLFATP